jgi:hypothetical protein
VLLVLLGVLVVALWPDGSGERPDSPPPHVEAPVAETVAPALPPPAPPPAPPSAPTLPPRGAAVEAPSREVLAAALREEMVPLASSVVIETLERDRAWVCEGESMGLAARLGGVEEPGAVYRWLWLTPSGSAELHPGPALQWKAPMKAGRYAVRFQVCTDLGGRRVGVLAERIVELEVRPCGPGERQEQEPLRLTSSQQGPTAFAFQAFYQGREPVEAYAWDFGDGATATTREPQVEHRYAAQSLGPNETRSFTVRLRARLSRGAPLSATAFVLVRGQPPREEPLPVETEVSPRVPLADGGWRSEVAVRSVSEEITWDRLERVTRLWDGGVEIDTRKWSEVVQVEEGLERGGFRGHVMVSPAEASPGIKQILDFLYGYDTTGKEVVVSWSPYKSAAPSVPPDPRDLPPRK